MTRAGRHFNARAAGNSKERAKGEVAKGEVAKGEVAPRPLPPYKRAPERRGARVADRGGLENRCACKRTVGSNPTLSANSHEIL